MRSRLLWFSCFSSGNVASHDKSDRTWRVHEMGFFHLETGENNVVSEMHFAIINGASVAERRVKLVRREILSAASRIPSIPYAECAVQDA
jgi:hypothetical protein